MTDTLTPEQKQAVLTASVALIPALAGKEESDGLGFQ